MLDQSKLQLEILELNISAKEAELKALQLQRKVLEAVKDTMKDLPDYLTGMMASLKNKGI